MRRKKAQMAGEVLIYIMAIIVFSLTLLYGYKAIKYFRDQFTQTAYLQMQEDITNEIDKVKSDSYGTVKKKVLPIPGDYREVCFVNSKDRRGAVNDPGPKYGLISDSLGTTQSNMFLYPPGDKNFNIGDIEVEENWQCVDVIVDKITLRLESLGDHVKVSKWQ